ncbi:leucine-rich repeat-containing protein 15-like [Anthonomus grandis grandis]|uniref:leucine-rich repeat-containing protein 15-like n=1 Tax=Anthonomus grandis grandis TaxID=2921223 RepID=UPI002165A0F9|nr:leucine-rich repeat-containing protein 15-like [Anthonomus grandis grandis]
MDVARVAAVILVISLDKRISCWPYSIEDSPEEDSFPLTVDHMGKNLSQVPLGNFSITEANLAYNQIQTLSPYVFYMNLYKNLHNLQLSHNNMSSIDVGAFRELPELRELDLSSNKISNLDSNTFIRNHQLTKLDLALNNITFDIEIPFLRSFFIQTLILSENNIIHVYDITFARMPHLTSLLLDHNQLYYLSPNCFVHLKYLQYINLANTGVYSLSSSMFRTVPRLVDLTSTTLSKKFEPPLKKVKTHQLVKLMAIEKFMEEDYEM